MDSQTFTVWITRAWTTLTWTTIAWITTATAAFAAPLATDAQVRACINAVIFELNGVPRSAIDASAGSLEADGTGLVNWSTRNGGLGFCRVDVANQVIQVGVEVDDSISQVPTPLRSSVAPGAERMVATDGGTLNVRSSPGGEIAGGVADGAIVVLTGQTSGEWVEIEGGGWVSQHHLMGGDQRVTNAAATATVEPAAEPAREGSAGSAAAGNGSGRQARIVTQGDGINVRSSPGGEVIFALPDGSTVNLTGKQENGWVELQQGGWVSELYLEYGGE
jgi:uncharacterized protein YgiM (DUF1202 family)